MKKFFVLFVLTLVNSSCSTVEFNTNGREPFYVSAHPKSEKLVEIVRTKDFYLWGLLPEVHQFNLQDETKYEGLYNPSYLTVEQVFSFKNVFFSLVTLGIYTPVDYKVSLLSDGDLK